jgi:hypothetical protein
LNCLKRSYEGRISSTGSIARKVSQHRSGTLDSTHACHQKNGWLLQWHEAARWIGKDWGGLGFALVQKHIRRRQTIRPPSPNCKPARKPNPPFVLGPNKVCLDFTHLSRKQITALTPPPLEILGTIRFEDHNPQSRSNF